MRVPSLRELQASLSWGNSYSRDFQAAPAKHKDFAHALHHVSKAAGVLHAVVDDLDHDPGSIDLVLGVAPERKVADLVICSLRLANTFPGGAFDLQGVLLARLAEKCPSHATATRADTGASPQVTCTSMCRCKARDDDAHSKARDDDAHMRGRAFERLRWASIFRRYADDLERWDAHGAGVEGDETRTVVLREMALQLERDHAGSPPNQGAIRERLAVAQREVIRAARYWRERVRQGLTTAGAREELEKAVDGLPSEVRS